MKCTCSINKTDANETANELDSLEKLLSVHKQYTNGINFRPAVLDPFVSIFQFANWRHFLKC